MGPILPRNIDVENQDCRQEFGEVLLLPSEGRSPEEDDRSVRTINRPPCPSQARVPVKNAVELSQNYIEPSLRETIGGSDLNDSKLNDMGNSHPPGNFLGDFRSLLLETVFKKLGVGAIFWS
jgi:hypothetical protein